MATPHLRAFLRRILPHAAQDAARQVRTHINRACWRGDRFLCPVCDSRLRAWRNVRYVEDGFAYDYGGLCPVCYSWSRQRQAWLYLRDRSGLGGGGPQRVLHFAPEFGLAAALGRLPNVHCLTADLSAPHAAAQLDIQHLSLPSVSFDAVVCIHVLEHVADDRQALRELFRVLKPGGWALLQVPAANQPETLETPPGATPAERLRLTGRHDHFRLYGQDFKNRLIAAGFAAEVVAYARELPEMEVRRYGLEPTEVLHLARKTTGAASFVIQPPTTNHQRPLH